MEAAPLPGLRRTATAGIALPCEPIAPVLRLMAVRTLAVTLVLASALCGCGSGGRADLADDVPGSSAHASPEPGSAQPTSSRTGPVLDGGASASCVESYSVKTIGNRAFAFDGTVVAIAPGGTNKPDTGALDTVAVTFVVNEWFKGGTDEMVTVDVISPTTTLVGDETPAYEQGARLLVSGEPRWGGQPLDDPIAWSCGGFTRHYEATVADDWRRGTG